MQRLETYFKSPISLHMLFAFVCVWIDDMLMCKFDMT